MKIRGQGIRIHHLQKQEFRVDVRSDGMRPDTAPVFEHYAASFPIFDQQLTHRRGYLDVGTVRLRRSCHCLGNRSHAAAGVTPCCCPAIDFAKRMMEQDIRSARVIRADHIANNAFVTEVALDRIAFEPAIQIVTHAHGHELGQALLLLQGQLAQAVAQLQSLPFHGVGCDDVGCWGDDHQWDR